MGGSLDLPHLDAGQLLKHILGLGHVHPYGRPIRLVYVCYDTRTHEAREHAGEITRFLDAIGNEIDFTALTYQLLFDRVRPSAEPEWVRYIEDRYFRDR